MNIKHKNLSVVYFSFGALRQLPLALFGGLVEIVEHARPGVRLHLHPVTLSFLHYTAAHTSRKQIALSTDLVTTWIDWDKVNHVGLFMCVLNRMNFDLQRNGQARIINPRFLFAVTQVCAVWSAQSYWERYML